MARPLVSPEHIQIRVVGNGIAKDQLCIAGKIIFAADIQGADGPAGIASRLLCARSTVGW